MFENTYEHCGTGWVDYWTCGCNDDCPVCGAEIEPIESRSTMVTSEALGMVEGLVSYQDEDELAQAWAHLIEHGTMVELFRGYKAAVGWLEQALGAVSRTDERTARSRMEEIEGALEVKAGLVREAIKAVDETVCDTGYDDGTERIQPLDDLLAVVRVEMGSV